MELLKSNTQEVLKRELHKMETFINSAKNKQIGQMEKLRADIKQHTEVLFHFFNYQFLILNIITKFYIIISFYVIFIKTLDN